MPFHPQYETLSDSRTADRIREIERWAQANGIDLKWDDWADEDSWCWKLRFTAGLDVRDVGAVLREIGATMERGRR